MSVTRLRPVAERVLEPFVRLAERAGLTPNTVSGVAFLAAVGAGVAYALVDLARWLYVLGAALVLLNGALDLLDGALARRLRTQSPAGDLLDHVLDRYADLAVVVGLAVGIDAPLVGLLAVTGVLMTSYLGTQAQAVGLDRVYGGVLGRANRLVLVGVVTVLAGVVAVPIAGYPLVGWLLVLFAVVGHLTALQRLVLAYRALD